MVRIANVAGLLSLAGAVWVIAPALAAAQPPHDYDGVAYEAARNKIGLMRYCRNNAFLSAGIADKAAAAVRLRPFMTVRARQKGDIAEKAGEDGFWEAGRRRDMASMANLFGTTPARLCQEWAQETLRTQLGRDDDATAVSPAQAPKPNPGVNRRRAVVTSQGSDAGIKPPLPAKADPVAAEKAAKDPPDTEAKEQIANWATGPFVIWTGTVRRQVRPPQD